MSRARLLADARVLRGVCGETPAVPLHTWLPDAHTEAPTAGSVILAGLLLKTGAYGLMRFAIPLFPDAPSDRDRGNDPGHCRHHLRRGACLRAARLQTNGRLHQRQPFGVRAARDLRRKQARAAGRGDGDHQPRISTGALFLIAGMLQERTHTRDLAAGRVVGDYAEDGRFHLLFALAALGLPGLGNFVGEFLVLLGTFQVSPMMASVASVGFVFSVIYALRLVQASMQGPNENGWSLPDLTPEIAILGSLSVIILWLGLYPIPIFRTARPT